MSRSRVRVTSLAPSDNKKCSAVEILLSIFYAHPIFEISTKTETAATAAPITEIMP